MEKKNGKERFIGMLSDMIDNKKNRGQSCNIELGIYKKKGVLPDSYPDDEPEEDYFSLFTDDIVAGDRVLIVWTDDGDDEPDMIAIGPLKSKGGDDDA